MTRIALRMLALVALAVGLIGFTGIASAQDMATPASSPASGGMHGNAMSGNGAAFLTIENKGTEADRLTAASTDVAMAVEIHEIVDNNGMKEMKPLENGLEIPAGESVILAPGGYHIMMIGLTKDLTEGMTFEMTLTFEKTGKVTVTVPVKSSAPVGTADPVEAGNLTLSGIWSRPAPALGMQATPGATPTM